MTRKPNLLFIFTDEQAAVTMGAYGNHRIHTPNMNKLASESIVFDNAYVTQPVCTPSRASIMTGLYPHTNQCTHNNIKLPDEVPCFPELGDFTDYKTAYHGKWHLGDEIFRQHGFSEWVSIEDEYRKWYSEHRDRTANCTYMKDLKNKGYEPDITTEDGFRMYSRRFCTSLPEEDGKPAFVAREAARFIRENRDHPFILYVNFLEPHMPFFGPRDDMYNRDEIPLPENFYHELTAEHPLRTRLLKQAYYELGYEGRPLKTEEDWRDLIARYWGLVSLVDTQLGKIMDALHACGLAEDTIVVYTSDHGDMMGSHRLLAKTVMFQEAVRVPLMLKIPGLKTPQRQVACPVSQIDLVPTLLEAMGQPIAEHLEGYSWMPFLKGEGALTEQDVFIEWNGRDNGFGGIEGKAVKLESWKQLAGDEQIDAAMQARIRTVITPAGWKYNASSIGEDELYDLNKDPYETTNLFGRTAYMSRIGELGKKILKWQERTGDSPVTRQGK